MKYKIIIVDDEEPARQLLVNYAQKIEELEIVAVLNNALEAKKTINAFPIDILLTDIQMDDLTGIDLLKNTQTSSLYYLYYRLLRICVGRL